MKSPKIAIIGQGITGLSFAYWLSEMGYQNITIIDKDPAYSASIRNAGFLTCGSAFFHQKLAEKNQSKTLQFAQNNIYELKDFIKENELINRISYREFGSYTLVSKEINLNDFNDSNFIYKEHSIETLKKFKSYFNPIEASFNPSKFITNFIKILKNRNIQFLNLNCLGFEKIKDKYLIKTNKDIIDAHYLIIATNCSNLVQKDLSIKRQRAQIASFELSNSQLDYANYYLPEQRIYFRRENNNLIIGGLRKLDEITESTSKLGINEKIQSELQRFVLEKIDNNAKPVKKWSGIMGFSSDELPKIIIKEHLVFVGGHSGHGNAFVFYLSKLLSKFIKTNTLSDELNSFMI